MIRRVYESQNGDYLWNKVIRLLDTESSVLRCDLPRPHKIVYVSKTGDAFLVVEKVNTRSDISRMRSDKDYRLVADPSAVSIREVTIMGRHNSYIIEDEEDFGDWLNKTML